MAYTPLTRETCRVGMLVVPIYGHLKGKEPRKAVVTAMNKDETYARITDAPGEASYFNDSYAIHYYHIARLIKKPTIILTEE